MKVAVNMRLPNGAEKTLVYSYKYRACAVKQAREEHPTWEVVCVTGGMTKREERHES